MHCLMVHSEYQLFRIGNNNSNVPSERGRYNLLRWNFTSETGHLEPALGFFDVQVSGADPRAGFADDHGPSHFPFVCPFQAPPLLVTRAMRFA